MVRIRNMDRDRDTTRLSTVTRGLRSLMITDEMADKTIPLQKANADAVTWNMILFSRYLEQRCIIERDNDEFFRDTIASSERLRVLYRTNGKPGGDIERVTGHRLKSLQHRRACMDHAIIQYFTNMKNHIEMNTKRFFIRYMKFYVGLTYKEAKAHVRRCLDPEDEAYFDGQFEGVNFKNLKIDTTTYIPIFMLWNELLEERKQILQEQHRVSGSAADFKLPRGLKQFSPIPIKKIQSNMCSYDFAAIFELWAQHIKIENKQKAHKIAIGQKPRADVAVSRDFFGRFFNLSKVERTNVKFAHHVMTDGVKVCVMVTKPQLQQIVPPPGTHTTRRIGVDPGCRVVQGMNVINPSSGDYENVLLTSKSHFNNTGMFARKNKLERITGAFEKEQALERERRHIVDGPELRDFQLESLEQKYALYTRTDVRRLKFDKSLRTLQATDRFVASHVADQGRTEVLYGNGWNGEGIRGYINPPQKQMFESFKRHPRTETRQVNEFRTSKCCCRCGGFLYMPDPMIKTHQGHRWVYCDFCHISMNRDANAGQNMWQKGLREKRKEAAKRKEAVRVALLRPQPAPLVPPVQQRQRGILVEQAPREGFQNRRWLAFE